MKYRVDISSDMGVHTGKYLYSSKNDARIQCLHVVTKGFWNEDRFFPASRVNYAEIVEDDGP